MTPIPDYNSAITENLDAITLARFLVMPGVPRLLHAFSRIHPGPLRDSVIHHAEIIAQTYEAPPAGPLADPLVVAADHRPTLAAAEAMLPAAKLPLIGAPAKDGKLSLEDRVIALRMEGKDIGLIARTLKADHAKVSEIVREARVHGGIKFPPKQARVDTKKSYQPVFFTALKHVPMGTRSRWAKTALKFNLSLEQFFDARKTFAEMRAKNATLEDISQATRVPEKELLRWLYNARAAGLKLPLDVGYQDAKVRPVLPIRAPDAPIRVKSHATCLAEGSNGAAWKIEQAAKTRGMSIPDYEYMREVAVDMALSGARMPQIAEAIGETPAAVNGFLSYAERGGVVFSPDVKAPQRKGLNKKTPMFPVADVVVDPGPQGDDWKAKLNTPQTIRRGALTAVRVAASARGMSIEGYFARRNRALELRMQNWEYRQIAREVNDNIQSVRDWVRYAESVGVTFPPLIGLPPAESLAAE